MGGTDNVLYLSAVDAVSRTGTETKPPDFVFRIFEHDGAETLSCGNGLLSTAAALHAATGGTRWGVLRNCRPGSRAWSRSG